MLLSLCKQFSLALYNADRKDAPLTGVVSLFISEYTASTESAVCPVGKKKFTYTDDWWGTKTHYCGKRYYFHKQGRGYYEMC